MSEINNAPTAAPMPIPRRLYVEFHAFPALRIQPHKTEADLLVVKCKHPEGVDMLLKASGVEVPGGLKTFKGHKYFITFLDRAYLALILPSVSAALALPPPKTEIEEYDNDSDELDVYDPDASDDEGIH